VSTDIDVSLSSCTEQDAEVVLQALARHFPAEPGGGRPAGAPAAGVPVVWSGRFDAHEIPGSAAGPSHPEHLDGQVVIRLSGTPDAVRQARAVFDRDFRAEYLGTALGDQEVEVSLVLR
jgi:hypothetical protein